MMCISRCLDGMFYRHNLVLLIYDAINYRISVFHFFQLIHLLNRVMY